MIGVSLAAAGRIPGVNPADVAVLSVWLEKRKRERQAGPRSYEDARDGRDGNGERLG